MYKPCYATMTKQTEEREALYNYKVSPGEHIPTNRECVLLADEAPEEEASEEREGTRAERVGGEDYWYWRRRGGRRG